MNFLNQIKWKIKKILWIFNIDIIKKKKNFNDIYKIYLNKNITIFDVGANKGQSIERFSSVFPSSTIHSFEPILENFQILRNKYKSKKNIFINSFALGAKNTKKKFFVNNYDATSSFLNITNKLKFNNFFKTKKTINVNLKTLDFYTKHKNIKNIDILKIDTQGYDLEVLKGSINTIKKRQIKFIELEALIETSYYNQCKLYEIDYFMSKNKFQLYTIDEFNYDKYGKIKQLDLLYMSQKNK